MLTGIAGFVLGLSTLVVWDRAVRAWQRWRFRREGWSSPFPGGARYGNPMPVVYGRTRISGALRWWKVD